MKAAEIALGITRAAELATAHASPPSIHTAYAFVLALRGWFARDADEGDKDAARIIAALSSVIDHHQRKAEP